MDIYKLTRFAIFTLVIVSGHVQAQAEDFKSSILEFIDDGATSNLSHSPTTELNECKILLVNGIKNNDRLKDFVNLKSSKEFVIYFVSNRSWGSSGIYYVGINENKRSVFIYQDDELNFKKKISFKKANDLITSMGDPGHFEYNSSPGVQDGNCSLFVYKNFNAAKSAVLTPGGSISASIGDPIGILKEWAETILPKQ